MTGRMHISAAGLELIKSFEGFREAAVRLPDGRWTIGYGHVRTAREGVSISPKDAEDLLLLDLKPIEAAVSSMVYAPLMQGQFDALVSLAFNISLGQFRESDVLRNLNAGDHLAAAAAFDMWRKARLHGRVMVVDALVRRRAAEKSLFLDHPSGPPSAPTPIVTPEIDFGAAEPSRPSPAPAEDEPDAAPQSQRRPTTMSDIAEAVRRLAEKTNDAVRPAPELPLPPGAAVAAVEPVMEAPVMDMPVVEPPVQQAAPGRDETPPAAPVTVEDLARSSRSVAERVSNILNGVQSRIDSHEAAAGPAGPKPARPDVREGMPDFSKPAEKSARAVRASERPLIDDTEVIEPGRDPAQLFAEGERKAKVVNGHAKRVGPISGRFLSLAPWIVVLVLSVLGFAIGAVEALKPEAFGVGAPQLAGTILAVFGVMTVMSLYFIVMKRTSDES